MKQRKAAANVFMEQNLLDNDDDLKVLSEAPAPVMEAVPQQAYSAPAGASAGYGGMPPLQPPSPKKPTPKPQRQIDGLKTSEELQLEKDPLRVRETGWWFWRRIVVPPNAYVVHTRIGKKAPVTLGLGQSFAYNPRTDAYLIVPAAMQTIGIVANCISKEKQGINILAYVQWQIQDFSVAYRKLDFSDTYDPLGIVNAQLREQAEAAIKDKIATMSVEEVLTDKQPVIAELTTRLKSVAEGDAQVDEGLGIKIVTVQIKEAIVSSQRLWEDLQAPFRYEQQKTARVSYLSMQDLIQQKELETRRLGEISEAETMVEIERTKQGKQTEAQEIRSREEGIRFTRDQEALRQRIQLQEETTRIQRESDQRAQIQASQMAQALATETFQFEQAAALSQAELAASTTMRQKDIQTEEAIALMAADQRLAQADLQARLDDVERDEAFKQREMQTKRLVQEQTDALQALILQAQLERSRTQTLQELELESGRQRLKFEAGEQQAQLARLHQEFANLVNERDLVRRLIEQLPAISEHMPTINDLNVVSMGNEPYDPLTAFLTKMALMAKQLGLITPPAVETE